MGGEGGESQSGVGAAGGGQGQGDACCFKTHICMYMGYSCIYINVCVRERSRVQICVTLWTRAHQSSLSTELSRQESWSALPCPPPGIFPTQGSNSHLLVSCTGRWIPYH